MMLDALPAGYSVIREDVERIANGIGVAAAGLAGRRLLLTGASGFLAAYMADTIAWLNDNVLDEPCTLVAMVRTPVVDGGRLGHLLGREDICFITQDVSSPTQIQGNVNFVVHAASRASPRKYLEDPLATIDANVSGTRHLLELARERESEKFLFLSSGEIYGNLVGTQIPIAESVPGRIDCTGERACYTESKRLGETLCMVYWRRFGVPVSIVRPFHVYGPGMAAGDGRVVAEFLESRAAGTPIRLLSDGSGVRAFCYISDATTAMFAALLGSVRGEALNVGDDREPIAMRDLAEMIARLEEPAVPVVREGRDTASHLRESPSWVCPDVGKARRLLGYSPKVGLQDGLVRTLAWYRECASDRSVP
ncbi:MAG: NAD-dependent epimerase/dehydratase family protein [Actinomycetota bacterium]